MKTTLRLVELVIPTADGDFIARYSASGLAELDFPRSSSPGRTAGSGTPDSRVAAWHRRATAAVQRVLAGRDAGTLPPLDLSVGTEFQQRVWSAMREIRAGQTRSYGELARDIGNPKAVRAVGAACGANPIPLLVPCHRVLAAGGKIGGFSGGLDWKRRLLRREGITLNG